MSIFIRTWVAAGLCFVGAWGEGAPDYLNVVKAYADAMLAHGRDVYGTVQSPLFAAALDRQTMALLEGEKLEAVLALPYEVWGIRPHDRMLSGANPMHDENLYQVLYALSRITGDSRYAEAADDALLWFFQHCQSPATGLMAWGEHIGWDFRTEGLIEKNASTTHEFFRPWMLWNPTYRLSREPALTFARGLWEHQIGDHATGNFSRHARWDVHGPELNSEYPRHGGFYIATWARAYRATREEVFGQAIQTLMNYFNGRRHPETGIIPSESAARSQGTLAWPSSNVSLAVDLHDGALSVPEEMAVAMREMAVRTDAVYLRLPHEPSGRGFVTLADTATLGKEKVGYADMWATGYGDSTNAQTANLVALRYAQNRDEGFKALVLACADRYRDAQPDDGIHLYPGTFGDVIWLELEAHAISGEAKYLEAAEAFAAKAAALFLSDGPLPRASSQVDHYEAITRGDTLMMALLRLWAVKQDSSVARELVYTDR